MPQKGFVYILTNQSMPNMVKVGKSIKVPTERAKELDTTGVPTPFEVQYYAFFDDMDAAERGAHNRLSTYHHRKEFFNTDVPTAIHAIENTDIPFQKLSSKAEDDAKAQEIERRLEDEEKARREKAQQNWRRSEKKRMSDTLQENTQSLISPSISLIIGIGLIVLFWNYGKDSNLFSILAFWCGAITCYLSCKKLFRRIKDRSEIKDVCLKSRSKRGFGEIVEGAMVNNGNLCSLWENSCFCWKA